MRKSTREFPFLLHDEYGAPLGGFWAAGALLSVTLALKSWRGDPGGFQRVLYANSSKIFYESKQASVSSQIAK